MWVLIDARMPGMFRVGELRDAGAPRIASVAARSHEMLLYLVRFLGRTKLMRAEGICVVQGPGSFTTVRTGVLLANLCARLFGKPLVGVLATEADDLDGLGKKLPTKAVRSTYTVLPIYDAEPNITLPSASP